MQSKCIYMYKSSEVYIQSREKEKMDVHVHVRDMQNSFM